MPMVFTAREAETKCDNDNTTKMMTQKCLSPMYEAMLEMNARVIKATQKLFPSTPDLLERMDRAARSFAWRYPYVKPEAMRHATTVDLHLVENPQKDPRSIDCGWNELHRAVCGVEHYGIHTEKTASALRNLKFQKFSQAVHGPYRDTRTGAPSKLIEAWENEFPKLKKGVYGIATKQLRESLSKWDPQLYQESIEIHQSFPGSWRVDSIADGQDPYAFVAQLVDPLTEGHRDISDLKYGLAGLMTFGGFKEGGDLVLKELGVRIAFPSGSHCHLRV
ncbi:hypothetical protein PG995_006697 [Apiospora arundinis]